jgi:hypothetical protein
MAPSPMATHAANAAGTGRRERSFGMTAFPFVCGEHAFARGRLSTIFPAQGSTKTREKTDCFVNFQNWDNFSAR